MKYHKNATVNSVNGFASHEDAISEQLNIGGYFEWIEWTNLSTNELCKFRKINRVNDWTKKPELSTIMPIGGYIRQPFGSQKPPDFLIKVSNSFVLALEAKSTTSNNGCPMWNSSIPSPHTLYVFSSKITNSTTIFRGDAIITEIKRDKINKYVEKRRLEDAEFNKELREDDPTNRGLEYYTRVMIIQAGGREFVNYFDHEDIRRTEEDALNWIGKME
jgi:hypothetical protein